MQVFIYKILPKKGRSLIVDFDVIWFTIQVGKKKMNLVENPKDESRNKALYGFLRTFRAGSGSFKKHWLSCHCQCDYPEYIPKSVYSVQKIGDKN